MNATEHWVVSCYLKLEPRDRARGKYLIKLKNRIRSREASLADQPLSHGIRGTIRRDLARIREYLEDPSRLPAGQGIALFASEPLGIMEVIPLPQVFRSRLAVDHTPLISELAAASDDFGVVIGVAYDRTAARFFRVTAFEVEELPSIVALDPSRTSRFHGASVPAGPGRGMAASGEYGHNLRIQEEKHRHYAAIANFLLDLSRREGVRGIVLGGVGVEADAVLPHLHPYVRGMVLGKARLNPKTVTNADARNAVLEVRRTARQASEAELVHEVHEAVGTGWATNGVESTLQALALGQLRTLLIRAGEERPGFRCTDWDRLTLETETCEGLAIPVEDVIDDALEEALRQRSHVAVVESKPLMEKIDGLAALLRFKL